MVVARERNNYLCVTMPYGAAEQVAPTAATVLN